MKKEMLGKKFAAVLCAAGLCVISGAMPANVALAQEDVTLPLDEAGAEAIALADAGVEEADAARLRTMREREDGEDVVEVEFSFGDNSYEYMLRESDGMILEWSIEGRAVEEAVAELTLMNDDALTDGTLANAQGNDAAVDVQTEADSSAEGQTDVGTPDGNAAGAGAQGDSAAAGSAVVKTTVDGTELAKIKFEYDGRFYDYELELREGRAEYEYKIDAQTGEIVEVERD